MTRFSGPTRLAVFASLGFALVAGGCSKSPATADPRAAANLEEGKSFLSGMAKEKGVIAAPRGIYYRIDKPAPAGAPSPEATDTVKIHYEGALIDGDVFDSSYERGVPAVYALSGLVECWQVAIPLLHKGDTATLFCPPDTAYGEEDGGAIPPNSTLIFKIELIDFR